MLSSVELLLVVAASVALIAYCLRDAFLRRRTEEAAAGWLVLLAIGLVLLPLGLVVAVAYLVDRRRQRRRSLA